MAANITPIQQALMVMIRTTALTMTSHRAGQFNSAHSDWLRLGVRNSSS